MLPRRVKRRAFRAVAAALAPPLAADAFDPPLTARKSNARRFAAFFSPLHSVERLLRGCAVTRRRFPVGARPTRRFAPAGSNRSRPGGDEMSEAFG
jgi:hypothetical protein